MSMSSTRSALCGPLNISTPQAVQPIVSDICGARNAPAMLRKGEEEFGQRCCGYVEIVFGGDGCWDNFYDTYVRCLRCFWTL